MDNLEEKLTSIELIREGLSKDVKKWQAFCSKVAKAVELDSTTAEMLTTGDFAHDAILMRAEQLVKQEASSKDLVVLYGTLEMICTIT